MNVAEEMYNEYQASGIWTMVSPRTSCVVPERPLILTSKEQWELSYIARMVWAGLCMLTNEERRMDAQVEWERIRGTGDSGSFPEGSTLPPAIRMDVVRTADGPKIVEIDPVSAVSLGETAFLADTWRDAGYNTVKSPSSRVVSAADTKGADKLAITLPKRFISQVAEQKYLARDLVLLSNNCLSVEVALGEPQGNELELSAFVEDIKTRRRIEEDGYPGRHNPLWGSLINLASKRNLDQLRTVGEIGDLRRYYLPKQFTREELADLDKDMLLVCKPLDGTGSLGVVPLTVAQGMNIKGEWVFQELLFPVIDDYGRCITPDKRIIESGKWITRLSIYTSQKGLSGAQATARQYEGIFTNAHGQSDAIQAAVVGR